MSRDDLVQRLYELAKRIEFVSYSPEATDLANETRDWADALASPPSQPDAQRKYDALERAVVDAEKGELFEDGLAADLGNIGIPEAYMAGRQDVLQEIRLREKELTALIAKHKGVRT